jgi:hypothetical protein
VPAEDLRALSIGETPYTVDAGHAQVEMSASLMAAGEDCGADPTQVYLVPMGLKLGLADMAELQVIVGPFHMMAVMSGDVAASSHEGEGAVLGLKVNLFGGDGGDTALAVRPHLTAQRGEVAGGMSLLLATSLPGDFSLGWVVEGDVGKRASGRDALEFLTVATLGHVVSGPLSMTVEVATSTTSTELRASSVAVNAGLAYGLGDDLQLDLGTRVGLLGEQHDVEVFLAIGARR